MSSTGASMARGKSRTDYATPWPFFHAVQNRFGPVTYDLAAHAQNAKHENYFTEAQNSLIQPWSEIPGWLWLNPPFDRITPWAKKCAEEAELGAKILFLTPASVGANWFAQHVHGHALILGLNGRISFDGIAPYPKDCILSIFGAESGFDVWRWTESDVI